MHQIADTQHLAHYVQERLLLLGQMRDLTRRQTELLDGADLSELLTVLTRKQLLLDRLLEVQTELARHQDEDPELRQWESSQARQQCQATAERCSTILQEVLILEQLSLEKMTARRDMVASQLQHYTGTSAVQAAYSAPSRFASSGLDLSSDN